MAARRGFMDALAREGARIGPRHRSRNTAFVKEDQMFRHDRPDRGDELFAALEVGYCVALSGVERLFSAADPAFVPGTQPALGSTGLGPRDSVSQLTPSRSDRVALGPRRLPASRLPLRPAVCDRADVAHGRPAQCDPLCRNLLRPAQAHHETFRQLFKRSCALVVGRQELPAQIIPYALAMACSSRRIAKNGLHYFEKCPSGCGRQGPC